MLISKETSERFRKPRLPAVADRVVLASLKTMLEPVFEADCAPRGAVTPGEVNGLAGLPETGTSGSCRRLRETDWWQRQRRACGPTSPT